MGFSGVIQGSSDLYNVVIINWEIFDILDIITYSLKTQRAVQLSRGRGGVVILRLV